MLILGPSACPGRQYDEKLPQPVVDGDFWSIADTYLCMEQYMMAGKAALFSDQEIRKEILACSDPKQIKALGRKVRGFEQKV